MLEGSLHAGGGTLEDGYDGEAIHWIIRKNQELIAAARLTVHQDLTCVPDVHLFSSTIASAAIFPAGYISRLVVHPEERGNGIAKHLDELRIGEAFNHSCKTLMVVYNPLSGESRRQQLLRLGFRSLDNETARADGAFGVSSLYLMDLTCFRLQ